ncbi:uncharacterized protein BT62DRAFT_1012093 [Guyanagaster necrorhizus]|uniref:Uncharacterized protein n=1 Tax=Guyanagaster necrorhizus TaxID=856835 RepID=A0A9P7VHC6_9AGAR|nr:uncharacterized protein BT62DRAFT_1012093 [Guyanagaster necrorhizus MCA 3950]KAG7441058.1 hypothetical protein BT62DRAFT_1012093 [Guyanagaster necrorhizus MCA 3950]
MRSTSQLVMTSLWQILPENMPLEERSELTYARCKSIVQHFSIGSSLTILCHPFQRLHCHVGDVFGSSSRPQGNHRSTFAFRIEGRLMFLARGFSFQSLSLSGRYCLTELGHGLDIINMETAMRRYTYFIKAGLRLLVTAILPDEASNILFPPLIRPTNAAPPLRWDLDFTTQEGYEKFTPMKGMVREL